MYAALLGGKAVDMVLEGQNNTIATLQWNRMEGFYLDSIGANSLRDPWGHIHARYVHPSFYDPERMNPLRMGIVYLLPIFTMAIGHDDVESIRRTPFDSGNLLRLYHSVNVNISKRICLLDQESEG